MRPINIIIENCSCSSMYAPQCSSPLVLRNGSVTVNGMFIGCLPLSSLMQSSLACFYNKSCLAQIHHTLQTLNLAPNLTISRLNTTVSSRFKPDTSLDNIINALLVESWASTIEYEKYFNQCNVSSCAYLEEQRSSLLVITSKLLGLCKCYFCSKCNTMTSIPLIDRWWNDDSTTNRCSNTCGDRSQTCSMVNNTSGKKSYNNRMSMKTALDFN